MNKKSENKGKAAALSGFPIHPPKDKIEPMMVIEDLSKIYRRELMKNAESTNVPVGYRKLLHVLVFHNGCSQLELSNYAHLKPPTVSLTIKKMESDGYIKREVSKSDLRIFNVYLTDKGMALHTQNIKTLSYLDGIVTKGISPEEKEALMKMLFQMRDNLCEATGTVLCH